MGYFIVLLIGLAYAAGGTWYVTRVLDPRNKKDPTPATWVMFGTATTMYVVSLALASHWDWKSGWLGFVDMSYCVSIAIFVLGRTGTRIKLRPFEKYYMMAAGLVVVFWIALLCAVGVMNSSFVTNLLVQTLILAGYFPTVQKILTERRNTEPFLTWYGALAAGVASLYPVLQTGKVLPMIYSVRTILAVSILLILMHRHHERKPQ